MITYSSQVTIERTPDRVFPYITDREKQALWSDVPMRPLTEGPLRVGSRMELTFGRGPMRISLQLELSELEADRRVAFTTVSAGSLLWDGEYLLEPIGSNATRMSQTGQLRFRGLWRLLEPMVGAEIRRNEIAELEKLKKVVKAAGKLATLWHVARPAAGTRNRLTTDEQGRDAVTYRYAAAWVE